MRTCFRNKLWEVQQETFFNLIPTFLKSESFKKVLLYLSKFLGWLHDFLFGSLIIFNTKWFIWIKSNKMWQLSLRVQWKSWGFILTTSIEKLVSFTLRYNPKTKLKSAYFHILRILPTNFSFSSNKTMPLER